MTLDPRVAFVEGLLDHVEGEIPLALWNSQRHLKGLEEWRQRCFKGLLANWDQFLEHNKPSGRLMRLYCLGVVRGMERKP